MGRKKGGKNKITKAKEKIIKTPPLCHGLLDERKQECSKENEHSQIVNNPLIEKNNIQISKKDEIN